MKYRKKPVVIEAIQFVHVSAHRIADWCGGKVIEEPKISDPTDVYCALDIPTLEGTMRANVNDFIIKGVHGEFYPCKPDIFAETYEPVGE